VKPELKPPCRQKKRSTLWPWTSHFTSLHFSSFNSWGGWVVQMRSQHLSPTKNYQSQNVNSAKLEKCWMNPLFRNQTFSEIGRAHHLKYTLNPNHNQQIKPSGACSKNPGHLLHARCQQETRLGNKTEEWNSSHPTLHLHSQKSPKLWYCWFIVAGNIIEIYLVLSYSTEKEQGWFFLEYTHKGAW
jgi:hypothetical protein